MRFGYSEDCLEHDPGARHPESPDRLRAIRRGLSRKHGVEYVDARSATVEEVDAVHDREFVERVREFCADGGGEWDPDTVAVEATWEAALASAGQARWAAMEAIDDPDDRETPFSLGRPPGHHAVVDDAMGFCFFNNAAIAAQCAIDDGSLDRVAIFDWDVHHGNGTQDIFYDRGDVCYVSIHEDGLYPGTGEIEAIGTGAGEGTTINAPLPAGAGDSEYHAVLERVVAPAIRRFDPELLLVSAGFDAHRHDPISRMRLTTSGYGLLSDRVRTMAEAQDAGLGFVLEGGYSLDMLAEGVGEVHKVLHGLQTTVPEEPPDEEVEGCIETLRELHGLGEK